MKTLKELNDELDQLEEQMHNVKNAIACHPETITSFFEEFKEHEGCKKIIDQVEFITHTSGWTNSRKNPVEWSGFNFKLKDSDDFFELRVGDNWCSSINECGKVNEGGTAFSMSMLMENVDDKGCQTEKGKNYIASQPCYLAVGYMLRCHMGW